MNKKEMKIVMVILVMSAVFIISVGCSSNNLERKENNRISISGSTSVGPLMEKISEIYEEENNGTIIEINQVGSSAGIKDAITKVSEIGMSSRELKEEEKSQVHGRVIAYDGIAIITNINNPIKDITINQIKDIYTGKITNWKEIEGGKDSQIVVTSREDGSGTRDAFQELIGYTSEELIRNAMISNGNGGLKEMVEGNKNAIAFVSFEYLDDSVNVVNVEGVEPKAESVRNKKYKIARPFLVITKEDNLTESGKKLIDYILSDEGQKIVLDNKLIPVK
ncbi:phosphate ABC transporter substrate-binding protein [Clostridium sp.]|uniref:phosphate ABC transporter substrate-binding protein n=1 Tax=Clostridium sp. TaxID=1506 RepID=UPI0026282047|nr:phosphate ABC transporter substrate-binding protein [Clostridium sp.]